MDSVLSPADRARIDNLTEMLRAYNAPLFEDALVSCVEAARLLRRSPKTISMMLREGRLTKRTIGKSTGIPLSEIRNINPL